MAVVALGASMASLTSRSAPEESGGSAALSAASAARVTGQVRATTDGKNWQVLKSGDAVKSGMLIQTAKKRCALEIDLGQAGLKVHLSENSVLGIKKISLKGSGASATREIEMDLRSGQMQGRIPSSSSKLDYEVEFPSGLVGARADLTGPLGTVYVLSSTGALAVGSGKVVISLTKPGTEPQVVAAGQQFDPANGRVTELPKIALERMLEESRGE